jgi:hypothetical protein
VLERLHHQAAVHVRPTIIEPERELNDAGDIQGEVADTDQLSR